MYRSSVHDVLLGAIMSLIALRYAMPAVDPANVYFIYYDSLSSSGVQVNMGHVNSRRAVYIIPSWNQMPNESWILQMKTNTMNSSAADVIVVDWSMYYGSDYRTTCEAVQGVGDVVGNFTAYSNNMFDTQINGFGMGAHVAGIAGKRVQAIKGSGDKIQRINALEPYKSWFEDQPIENRVDAGDATVVQVFHTSFYSMPYIPGTVGVFFNCYDIFQPNCWDFDCSSLRAALYYSESILTRKFVAVHCNSCFDFFFGLCSNITYVVGARGGSTPPNPYYLETTGVAPWYIE